MPLGEVAGGVDYLSDFHASIVTSLGEIPHQVVRSNLFEAYMWCVPGPSGEGETARLLTQLRGEFLKPTKGVPVPAVFKAKGVAKEPYSEARMTMVLTSLLQRIHLKLSGDDHLARVLVLFLHQWLQEHPCEACVLLLSRAWEACLTYTDMVLQSVFEMLNMNNRSNRSQTAFLFDKAKSLAYRFLGEHCSALLGLPAHPVSQFFAPPKDSQSQAMLVDDSAANITPETLQVKTPMFVSCAAPLTPCSHEDLSRPRHHLHLPLPPPPRSLWRLAVTFVANTVCLYVLVRVTKNKGLQFSFLDSSFLLSSFRLFYSLPVPSLSPTCPRPCPPLSFFPVSSLPCPSCLSSILLSLISILPFFLDICPSFLPSFLPPFLPSFLPSFLDICPSYLSFFIFPPLS
jgi:hypothetical protein